MKNIVTLILTCALMFGAVGCAKKTTSGLPSQNPSQVPSTFDQSLLGAADAIDLTSTGASAIQQTAKSLLATQQITLDTYNQINNLAKSIASKNEAARLLVQSAQQGNASADWKTALIGVAGTIRSINPTTFGIKDSNAQTAFQQSLTIIQAVGAAILASYGG